MSLPRFFTSKSIPKEKKAQKPSSSGKPHIDVPPTKPHAENPVDASRGSYTLNSLQLKQRRAREALKNLQVPPKQTGPQLTPEHHRVLSENVRLLIDVTSEPQVTDDENLKDGYSGDDGDFKGDGDYENDLENGAEDRDTQKQPSKPEKSTHGKKRQREEREDTNGQANQAAKRQRQSKKSKLRTDITQHLLEDFETLKPQPVQYVFREHPLEDRSDEWYIEQFRALFRRICTFAHDFFGLHDIDEGEFHQPWAAGMIPEFIRHVEDVAEADQMTGGWDTLLRNTVQRQWLIVAIITRILEIHVFGADLWGAEPHEKDLLLNLERALFTREGFSRTSLRSITVRTIIGQRSVTSDFDDATAKLTAKIAVLLKPLTFFLYSRPTKDGVPNQRLEDQCQALHNIIGIAAYLSICIRLSPTIFYFSSVTPNTRYESEDQHNVDAECYSMSEEAVTKSYKAAEQEYLEKKEALEEEIARLKTAGNSDTSRACRKAQARLDAHTATEPNHPERTHEPMSKIGVWPNISRFKPGEPKDDDAKTPLADRKGLRIRDISKSAVACYYGLENRVKRAEQRVGLEDFVQQKIKKYGKTERGIGKGAVLVVAAAAAGIPYLLYGWNVGGV